MCASGRSETYVLTEDHRFAYLIHPGGIKIYQDLKKHFWWNAMKREIAQYVAKCLICHQVKAEYQRAAGPLQPLAMPEWK